MDKNLGHQEIVNTHIQRERKREREREREREISNLSF